MLSTDAAWKKWGEQNPYFGGLARDRFHVDRITEHRAEFFESGRRWVAAAIAQHERHFGPLARGRALDHGCGVGRLSVPLAREFAEVVAIDVAPAMLAEAAANADEAQATNVRFAVADDDLSEATGSFDWVISLMVLQHVPVRRGLMMIDALLDRVAPGGGFHLHVSARTDRWGRRWLYWASANIPGVKIWQNICARRAWNAPAMQMNDYPLGKIIERLTARGISEILLLSERHARFFTSSLIGRMPA